MTQSEASMTNQTIPPCPACGVVPELVEFERPIWVYCCGNNPIHYSVPEWSAKCTTALGRAMRDIGIETVEQVRELVGIACDACDERTVRATNRAENLVPLLRRRAAKGEK